MAARPALILLAGAPDTEDLDWDDNSLAKGFHEVFARILNGRRKDKGSTQTSSMLTPTAPTPKWRVSRVADPNDAMVIDPRDALAQTQFLSFHEKSADEEREHSDFLEHSVAVFDNLVSSQILQRDPAPDGRGEDTIMMESTTSFATTSLTDSSFNISEGSNSTIKPTTHAPSVAIQGGISNLNQIPGADYIACILPQTMTVNLIAGVVTVPPARTVHLKKSNTEMDIIELVVGDETRAGFTISFWLAPLESQNKAVDDLRDILRTLRAGDIVLLQNVALSCFRNCVYGQSLSKRFARNSTLITLMNDDTAPQLPGNVSAKLQRVQDWISDFVGLDKKLASFMLSSEDVRAMHSVLPPDTQD